jgi:cell division septation protein DedD
MLGGFFLWWGYLTKSVRERNGEPLASADPVQQPPALQASPDTSAAVSDTASAQPAASDTASMQPAASDTASTRPVAPVTTPAKPEPKKTEEKKTPPELTENLDSPILVTEDIGDFSGKFLVHVSSFQGLDLARREAYYLNDRGYPIVIARVDLGSKGKWYRVFVGPSDRRTEARNLQKRLDEIPRVKFTDIKKIER